MKRLKALLVEDSETDEQLLLRQLAKADYDVQSIRVQTAADLKKALVEREWDIVLSDFAMPGFTGLDALRILQASGLDIPLIIISGTIGEDVAVEAMRIGVNDYLLKGNLTRLAPAIERELENAAIRRAQKQAEEALRQSESRMRALLNAIPDLMFRCSKTGEILDFNATHEEGLLLPPSEFIGKNLRDMMPPPVTEQSMRHITLAIETGAMQIFEYRLEVNGSGKSYEARIVAASDNEVTAIIRDVTERQQAEDKIRRSEASLANAQRIAHIGSWDWDVQNNKLLWSDEIYRIFGLVHSEFKGTYEAFFETVHPEDRQKVQSAVDATLTRNAPHNYEHRIVRPDGEERNVCEIGETTFDESGKPLRFTGTVQDITERKRAADALENAAKREMAMIENALDVICTIDAEGKFASVSPASLKVWGYQPEELVGQAYSELVVSGEVAKTNEVAAEIMSGVAARHFENRYVHKNGTQVDMRWTAYWSEAEQLMFCVAHDITERKQADRKIRESEERYRIVAETANDVIITVDERSSILFVNSAMEKTLGYKPEELIGENLSVIVPERLRASHHFGMNRYLQTGKKHISWSGVELPALHRDGSEIQIEVSFSEYQESNQRFFTGVMRDITERKQLEQLMIESEEKYRSIVETANEGIWLTDAETRATYVNRQMAEMLGYTVDEMLGRPIFDFIFDEDLPAAKHKYEQRLTGKSETGEFRLRRKDGSELITLYNTTPKRNQAGEIVGFLSMRSDITVSKKAERELRYAEARYRSLVESSPAIVYLAEPHPPFSPIYVSPNISRLGYTTEEWFDRPDLWVSIIHDDDRAEVLRVTEDAIARNIETDLEYRVMERNGSVIWLHDKGRFVLDAQGNKTGWQGVMVDITKTKELEERLRQAQKLESVGKLAGGIAHDFNNMLTAINGYSELTLRLLKPDDPLRENIEEIKKAGEQSAVLTHQLLAFSRQQILKPVVLDINEVITDTIKLLQRLINEDIELVTTLNTKTGRVSVDPGQLSQIIVNLAVNARDAMPHGGKLTIETANGFLEPNDIRQKFGILPGAYVILSVCDTGHGIDEKIQQQIFEPFFTTKELGKGTGLGLATVYGIVKQSGGNIEFDSKVGVGTTFRVYLPRVAEQRDAVEIADPPTEFFPGTETILLVEDEKLVRKLSRKMLETCGYTVIEARDGLEALKICDDGSCKIDLLMTDVVMPQMGGWELAEKLAEKLPDIKILFTSGYTGSAVIRYGVTETDANFIQKPFTFEAINLKVRKLLDE